MEAGSESSSMNLHLFVLAMMAHPHVFKKAQQEVDEVCGSLASPTAEHINKLPYMQAIMMEVNEPEFTPPARAIDGSTDLQMATGRSRRCPSYANPG
jgi:hypothetical protein